MADTTTLARPYTKVAFDYAYESSRPTSLDAQPAGNSVAQWSGYLNTAQQIINDAEFQKFLVNPKTKVAQKTALLLSFFETKPSREFNNFIDQLAQNDRLLLLSDIATQFDQLKAKATQQVNVTVTSAYPLTQPQIDTIATKLKSSLGAEIIIQSLVDQSLIGGATVKIGDKVVDASVKGKLRKLKTELTD